MGAKLIFKLAAAALLAVATSPAAANASAIRTCNMSFQATGPSIYIGVGFTALKGSGQISCYDYVNGVSETLKIKVTARGPGAGLGVTGLVINGAATGIGVSKSIDSLLGKYIAVRANAAIGVGAGAAGALHFGNGSATIDVSVHAQGGLGVGVDILGIDIEADGDRKLDKIEKQAAVAAATPAPAPVASPAPAAVKPALQEVETAAAVSVPVRVLYVTENQPVHLVDAQGKLLQVLYLKSKKQ